MKYAYIVPLTRTPFGVNGFDYIIPADLEIKRGDLVFVPFRKAKIVGLVDEIKNSSVFADRAHEIIEKYSDLRLSDAFVDLLAWTARTTFCSKPTVLKAWLRNVPKRTTKNLIQTTFKKSNDTVIIHPVSHWLTEPTHELIACAQKANEGGLNVLIITPWKARAEYLYSALDGSSILHSDLADKAAFFAWTSFIGGACKCLITTRLGAWLSPMADIILIDEPDNDDHKQDELSPRYDARQLALWCNNNLNTPLEVFGTTPPLRSNQPAPTIVCQLRVSVWRSAGRSDIPFLQGDTVEMLRAYNGPRIVIHPVRGFIARFVCRDCGWRATCDSCESGLRNEGSIARCISCGKKSPAPLTCEKCRGVDLNKSIPGVEILKRAWEKQESSTPISWRSMSNEDMETQIPENAIVVVTEISCLAGASEDVRRSERTVSAFRKLAGRVARVHGLLVIQCDEHYADNLSAWLTTEGFDAFRKQELQERKLFLFPPAFKLIKVIINGSSSDDKVWQKRFSVVVGARLVRGPFPVAFRPKNSKARFIYHIIFDRNEKEEKIIAQFNEFADEAIIDLDPIAFLK